MLTGIMNKKSGSIIGCRGTSRAIPHGECLQGFSFGKVAEDLEDVDDQALMLPLAAQAAQPRQEDPKLDSRNTTIFNRYVLDDLGRGQGCRTKLCVWSAERRLFCITG